jgi:hypothetical protein
MIDFDCWLLTAQAPGGTVLSEARTTFWNIVREGGETVLDTSSYTVLMPLTLRNNRKRPMISDPPGSGIPESIPPFDESSEKKVVSAILCEINDIFGLRIDTQPDSNRDLDPASGTDTGRLVLVGASHMHTVAKAQRSAGADVIDLSTPGWYPTAEKIQTVAAKLRDSKLSSEDIVFLDIWLNSAFVGSDEFGFPLKAFKDPTDRTYHIEGDLQAAPSTVLRKIALDCTPILEAASGSPMVIVVPFPRYVGMKCCENSQHITNFGTGGCQAEAAKVGGLLRAATSAVPALAGCHLFSLTEQSADTDLSAWLQNAENPSAWRDPVHPVDSFYVAAAAAFIGTRGDVVSEREPPGKRRRLDSIAHLPTRGGPARGGGVQLPPWILGKGSRGGQRYNGGRNPATAAYPRGGGGGRGGGDWYSSRSFGGRGGRGIGRGRGRTDQRGRYNW